ncbi:hypothetical protein [Marilutibacter chinensis]|uniref:hypothetical protein n=1 Tax=Marilutibacter chinensis TaxID=2912247 RepID=UPI001F402CF2|nr:hypothetical protein [Lysobacter chinensis]
MHSFIDREEYSHLTTLVSDHYTGKGIILDAGCFAGSSTLALCAGIPKDVLKAADSKLLVAIDRFVVGDSYLTNHFLGTGEDIRYGESFLTAFLDNVASFLPWIEVRAGEVTQVGRLERPIEILFLDVAKSPYLNAYALRHWFSRLTESGIVIQQDFYSPAHHWIAASMGALLDCFDVVTERVGETAVFRLRTPPDAAALTAAGRTDQHQQSLRNLDRMIGRLSTENRPPLLISKAKILNRGGNSAEAKAMMRGLLEVTPDPAMTKWDQWLSSALQIIAPELLDAARTKA